MPYLMDLYKQENNLYPQLPRSQQKAIEVLVHKKIVKICGFTSRAPISQWKKNGGLIPISSAAMIAASLNGLLVSVSDYKHKKRGPKPKSNQISALNVA
jgi:hypothetical protein